MAYLWRSLKPPGQATWRRSASSKAEATPIKRHRLRNPAGGTLALLAGVAAYDHFFQEDAILRSLRTGYTGVAIAVDYKLNFRPGKVGEIAAMHQRVADRLHYLCVTNAGLYIKLGQALGMQAAILPKPYRDAFANIFDAAPALEWSDIQDVFLAEFGKQPEEMFDTFDRKSIAAASIAQVHRATLNGKDVAVKIQRPAIRKQIDWDLYSFKLLMQAYEWLFEIPTAFATDFIAEQMRKETSFVTEATNAEKTAANVAKEPTLRDRVYIPKVYWERTTERVMTADFVAGACRLNEKQKMEDWGFDLKEVMTIATDLFAAMIFKFGDVHCDPHSGNVLVRPHPNNPRRPQIALIDHGLYITMNDQFRGDYSLLWRSLFMMDTETIDRITKSWGIANSDMFASATLLRPFKVKRKTKSTGNVDAPSIDPNSFEAQQSVKERLKSMLENADLLPRELIFLARCMRMNQASNQILGSPVNRINLLAHWAAAGVQQTSQSANAPVATVGIQTWFSDLAHVWIFKVTLLFIDAGFLFTRLRQKFFGREQGFEDLLQKQITDMARDEFGVELDQNACVNCTSLTSSSFETQLRRVVIENLYNPQ